jgi:hypothetical protein
MCKLTEKTQMRSGYKVLGYKNNKFYSTFTGQQIKVGNVPKPPTRAKRLSSFWTIEVTTEKLRSLLLYNEEFAGKTGAFTNLIDARNIAIQITDCLIDTKFTIVIVYIVFKGTVYSGAYNYSCIIAGDTIKSMKIIKQM